MMANSRIFLSLRRMALLNRNDRVLFYRLLSAQVRAGLVVPRACRELAALDGLPRGIRMLAEVGGRSELEGRPVIEGLARTGLLPDEDVAMLSVAREYGSIPEGLDRLANPEKRIPGIFDRVVAPNLYYLMILCMLFVIVLYASLFFEQVRLDGSGNPLYEASLTLQFWTPLLLFGGGPLLVAAIWTVKRSTSEPLRKLTEPFDTIERLRIGIRFCHMAAMMTHNGAVGTTILEFVSDVFRSNRYLRHHALKAHERIVTEGTRLEDALAGGVLRPRYATLLKGLVPGRAFERYETGYRTLADVQQQMLERRLKNLAFIFNLALLGGCALGFVTIIEGVYSLQDSLNAH